MDITILQWLKAKSNNLLVDNDINVIALEREVEDTNEDVSTLSLEQKELLYADCLMAVANTPIQKSEGRLHDGFEQRSSYTLGNQKSNIRIAMSIYKKYSDPNYELNLAGKTTLKVVKIIENTIKS